MATERPQRADLPARRVALPLSALAARLRALDPSCGGVRLVAIDGPSGAGKSTLAGRLARVLPEAAVVRSDDFPVPWDGDPLAWWPPLAAQILQPLAAGRDADYRPYDWKSGTYRPAVTLRASLSILIVEGVGAAGAQAPAAFRIWVDAPFELRRQRAISRDGGEFTAAWEAWTVREESHFAADRTRARADLIVDGCLDPDRYHPHSVMIITV